MKVTKVSNIVQLNDKKRREMFLERAAKKASQRSAKTAGEKAFDDILSKALKSEVTYVKTGKGK